MDYKITGIYTNSNENHDFVANGFVDFIDEEMDVFIASAFLTDSESCQLIFDLRCHLKIVVRLGFPTCPNVLDKLLQNKNVEVRYFTSQSFHPKLYIFGNKNILVGSANFTKAGFNSNQEIVLSLNPSDSRFTELTELFSAYWEEAKVLDNNALTKYKKYYHKILSIKQSIKILDGEINEDIGKNNFSNISRDKVKKNKKSIFIDSYKKSYQECTAAFERIRKIYEDHRRRVPESVIPLRMEIDSFISFVRDVHAKGTSWEDEPIGWDAEKKAKVNEHIKEWMKYPYSHFDETIVKINYPLITSVFGSKLAIEKSSPKMIVDALCVLHSFMTRHRFFKGGLPTMKTKFLELNDIKKVRSTLQYLLFGEEGIVEKMANCIYNNEYKLEGFGESNVQELVGWINNEDLPVINGKTTKVLRFYGFDVKQN